MKPENVTDSEVNNVNAETESKAAVSATEEASADGAAQSSSAVQEVDTARFGGGLFHGAGDLFQIRDGKSLFDDEGAGKIPGLRPHAGKVGHRAADAQFADGPPGELPRGNDEAVGGEGDLSRSRSQYGGVVPGELRVGEMGLENLIDEFVGLTASGAVGER